MKIMLGTIMSVAYVTIFTIRKDYTPKLAAVIRANTYDLNRNDKKAKEAAQRKRGLLTVGIWALRLLGWAENVLLVLIVAWLVYVIGALLTVITVPLSYLV